MDMEALVAAVVREVLRQLRPAATGPRVLVLEKRSAELARTIAAALGEDVDIVFWGEDAGRLPVRYLLPRLSCEGMAGLAAGMALGDPLSEVLRLLLSGKKVEVLEFAYKAHAETAPAALYALYESHAKTLSSYGLIEFQRKAPAEVRLQDTLVTESVIKKVLASGTSRLLVPADAVVTPLAADAAKASHLTIVKGL